MLGAVAFTLAQRAPNDRLAPAAQSEGMWLKPSMGWNSWNHFACAIDEALIRGIADAMVSSGLQAAGYDVVTLDACWSARDRDGGGNLWNDPQAFPSGMKALGDYIHSKGLRFGIYASIGSRMCADVGPGSLDHELQDAATFASWGVDYIKADRCSAEGYAPKDLYARWRDAIAASGRPMVLSASDNTPTDEPWAWGPVTAHQWRMSPDIRDDWTTPSGGEPWRAGMIDIFDRNGFHAAATAPGSFNDPDMLEVGNGGMTDDEYRTHFGLWALMSAPLIAGNDVRYMSPATLETLTHPEVIGIDQDPLAFQAIRTADDGAGRQVWYKPLDGQGVRAVGLLNRGGSATTITVTWTSIGLKSGPATVRDVWARTDLGSFVDAYSVSVPPHGLALLRVVGTEASLSDGFLSDQPWTYMANEVGPAERDMSNGYAGSGDGRPMSLNGVAYAKGIGVHAPSAIEFRSDGNCSSLAAQVGVDDEVGDQGSVVFQVWGDGQKLFESVPMTGAMSGHDISVEIAGRRGVRLQVVAVDSTMGDHADWANARVTCGAGSPPPPPPPNQAPQASFTASPSLVRIGEPVSFNAAASHDPDGTIVSYAWDFGDGSTGQGMLIDHAYSRSGRFTVALTVADNGWKPATATADVVVDEPPAARFTAAPQDAVPGTQIRFDASASHDPDGTILSYAWDFGDGHTAVGISAAHAYSRRGAFLARLEVRDDLGVANGTTQAIGVSDRPPVILNSTPADPVTLEMSSAKTFVVVASDPDGDGLRYAWTVDGRAAPAVGSSYTFVATVAGTFLVQVVVSDGMGSAAHTWAVNVNGSSARPAPPAEVWTSATVQILALTGASVAVGAVVAWIVRRRPL